MNVSVNGLFCLRCILNARLGELERLLPSDRDAVDHGLSVIEAICREYRRSKVRAFVEGFRLVKKITGVEDPYLSEKLNGERIASKLAERLVKHGRASLRRLIAIAVLGNSFDAYVEGYSFSPEYLDEDLNALRKTVNDKVVKLLLSANKVVYLFDNSGEAIFDLLLIEELQRRGVSVVAVVKGKPFEIDVSLNDVKRLGIEEIADTIVCSMEEYPAFHDPALRRLMETADVVVSKGLANYVSYLETTPKLGTPVIILLRAKCQPVARSLRVGKGDYVVRLVRPNF